MVWFREDDSFYDSPPVVAVPRDSRALAVGTYLLAGTWSARHLTDGAIPGHMVEELGGSIEGANALVKAGIWRKVRAGFQFIVWAPKQPTRAEVEEQRESERKRKAAYRDRAKGRPDTETESTNGTPEGVPPGHEADTQGDASGSPDTPTRPDPTPTSSTDVEEALSPPPSGENEKRDRRRAIPEGFTANDAHRQYAHQHHLDLAAELERFRNHALMTGRLGIDWDAGFRNWLAKAAEHAAERRPGRGPAPSKDDQVLDVLQMGADIQAEIDRKAIAS